MTRQILTLPHREIFAVPDGPDGTRIVLQKMADLVEYGVTDPPNRLLVQRLTVNCPPKAWMTEIRTIFNFVRQNIRYLLDTDGIEVLQSPEVTLEMQSGDCDDHCILLATLLRCAGHPCRFVALGFRGDGELEHVITQTRGAGEGRWVSLDTTEDEPMGWFPPGHTDRMIQRV